jgi:hypothetical protein
MQIDLEASLDRWVRAALMQAGQIRDFEAGNAPRRSIMPALVN